MATTQPALVSRESARSSDSSSLDGAATEKQKLALNGITTTTKTKQKKNRRSRNASPSSDLTEEDVEATPKRWKSFWSAFRYLSNLNQKQVDDFMASYVIYNLDWSNEQAMVDVLGANYQEKVGDCLKSYYGVLNHLCALGDVEKMYIPPYMSRKANVLENQLLYERSIIEDLQLKPGQRVLDLGCGRGRVAAHIARVADVHITGLNIDPNQIAQAREFNEKRGFVNNSFVEQDFNSLPLPFDDQSFDGFYQIQAFSLCKDLRQMCAEIFRILKPGARFSMLDWVSYPDYDPENPEHAALMRRVKPLIGAVGTPTPKLLEDALTDAGFTVERSDNASLDGLQAPLIETVDTYFRTMRHVILGLVKVRMLPPHFKTLINRLCLDGEAFVEMDYKRLITTSYRIIAQKPER